MSDRGVGTGDRVAELLAQYGTPSASTATLLCDRHDPGKAAFTLINPDLTSQDLTFGELRRESEALAAGFARLGVRPGSRVATLMGKSRAYFITLMAIWRLGAVHVPLFTAFAPPAIALRLTASGAVLVVTDAAQRAKLEPGEDIPADAPWRIVALEPGAGDVEWSSLLDYDAPVTQAAALGGDAAIIEIFTSGTTGRPKGVPVPLKAVAGICTYMEFGLDVRQDDVFWNAADPGWAYGLFYAILGPLAMGKAPLILLAQFTPETTYEVLTRYGVTNFAAAPTIYRSLKTSGAEVPAIHLRCASSAGEPLTPDVNLWAQEALGVEVRDHYGFTEAGMVINNHNHPALRRPVKPGSMGQVMPGWTMTVLKNEADEPQVAGETGRLALDRRASPLAWFNGYMNDPAKSAEKLTADGRWYLSGDAARVDEEGYFHFAARDDDLIIMAGYRISPFEVESVLVGHPAIAECAVIATPDEVRGEVLEAVVVLSSGHAASDDLTAELQQRVKKGFAAHAYPRRIHYVDALPKTPSGKVQRFLLRERYRQAAVDAA